MFLHIVKVIIVFLRPDGNGPEVKVQVQLLVKLQLCIPDFAALFLNMVTLPIFLKENVPPLPPPPAGWKFHLGLWSQVLASGL